MAAEESNPLGKLIVGVLIGMGLSYAYVRFGYKPPAVVQIAENVTDSAIASTATMTLYSPSVTDAERRRALALYLSKEPETLIDIDRAMNGAVMQEVLRRKALRQAKVMKHQMSAYDVALQKPAIRRSLERKHGATDLHELKHRMLAAAIKREEFLYWYLKQVCLSQADQNLVNVVLGAYQNELRPGRIAVAPNKFRQPQ